MTEWRSVVGYEGVYEVADDGRVRSVARCIVMSNGQTRRLPERVRTLSLRPDGHLSVSLSLNGRQRQALVHHLVLEAFVGPRPSGKWGLHNDGNALENARTNLRWDWPAENVRDTVRHGANHNRAKTHCPARHELRAPNLTACSQRLGNRQCLACARARSRAASTRRRGGTADLTALRAQCYAEIITGTDLATA